MNVPLFPSSYKPGNDGANRSRAAGARTGFRSRRARRLLRAGVRRGGSHRLSAAVYSGELAKQVPEVAAGVVVTALRVGESPLDTAPAAQLEFYLRPNRSSRVCPEEIDNGVDSPALRQLLSSLLPLLCRAVLPPSRGGLAAACPVNAAVLTATVEDARLLALLARSSGRSPSPFFWCQARDQHLAGDSRLKLPADFRCASSGAET
jgi:hypothetical protein